MNMLVALILVALPVLVVTQEVEEKAHKPPPIDFKCVAVGSFPSPDQSCDKRFVVCDTALRAHTITCSRNTYYDTEYKVCLRFHDVPACTGKDRQKPETTTEHTTVEPTATTSSNRANIDCNNRVGNLPEAAGLCSQRFVVCDAAGIARYSNCAAGTYYDEELLVCLFYHQVPSCSGTPRPTEATTTTKATTESPPTTTTTETTTTATTTVPTTTVPTTTVATTTAATTTAATTTAATTTAATTTVQQPTSKALFECPSANGNFPLKEQPCAPVFWQCRDSVATQIVCPDKNSFDPTRNSCVPVSNNTACVDSPCFGREDGLYASSRGNCGEYLTCLRGWPIYIDCQPAGLVWDASKSQCADPSEVAAPCGLLTTPAVFTCDGRSPGNYDEPGTKCLPYFYQCHTDELPVRATCPDGLLFKTALNKCTLSDDCLIE